MNKRVLVNAREYIAELIGTFILVFFGIGSVHVAVLLGGYAGLWQVASIWGIGVALAIYATAAISGAHLNPAITVAFAVYRKFPRHKILPYVFSQLLGAVAAAAVLYLFFYKIIADFELTHGILRGQAGSELSAMIFGEYFPNPAMIGFTAKTYSLVSPLQAMLAEGVGTAFLAFFIFALTDDRNSARPKTAPLFIGLAVAMIISIIAPLTQAGLNPARDFGPRLVAYFAGWKTIAIPGPRGGFFTVYIFAPIIGALLGAGIYQFFIQAGMPNTSPVETE
jgi:glycerol uptake facilitator protein